MGKCRYVNQYGFICGERTAHNRKLCARHEQIEKLKKEGLWEETLKKAQDKDYDPYKEHYGSD